MISPLNFDETYHLPPQQFKVAVIQVLNELIEQANREEKIRINSDEKVREAVVTEAKKRGRPSGKTR